MIYKGEDMDIIDLYVRNMSVSNVRDFAYKNDIALSDEETDFVYNFIKNRIRSFRMKLKKVYLFFFVNIFKGRDCSSEKIQ